MNSAELLQRLKNTDEVLLLELLELTSDQLVDAFYDLVVEHEDKIRRALQEQE